MSQVMQEIESPKNSVLWTGFEVLLFFAVWLAPLFVSVAVTCVASLNQPQTETIADTADHGHPIAQLIEQSQQSPMILLIVFLSAVVAAPIIEEFLFRMLFQGWLEVKLKRSQIPCASGVAIVIVSLFFAAIHVRNHEAIDASALINGIVLSSVFSLLVFTAGIVYLVQVKNVRVADYLLVTERLFRPRLFICVGYCLLAILFCLALNAVLTLNFPGTNLAPISIFFFSLALGVLYSRTQNLSYCILFHACLNGISLALVWLSIGLQCSF